MRYNLVFLGVASALSAVLALSGVADPSRLAGGVIGGFLGVVLAELTTATVARRRMLKPQPEPTPGPQPAPVPDPVVIGDGWIRVYSGARPADGKPLPGTLVAFARLDAPDLPINTKTRGTT